MERYFWKGKIVDGKQEEYIKRHNEIWKEMKDVLKKAGIRNYSIYMDGNEVYGYYECKKGVDYSNKIQNTSEVVDRWNEFMKDILIFEKKDESEAQPKIKEVFHLK